MIFYVRFMIFSGVLCFLLLGNAQNAVAGNTVDCSVSKAPSIKINPVSNDIRYDFSKSSDQLNRYKSNSASPYPVEVDTTTGGLRVDQPELRLKVQWGIKKYPTLGKACLWYDSVNLDIELSPKIYVAKENSHPVCRNAIVKHELMHVEVDRKVINRYTQQLGKELQRVINETGVLGPIELSEIDEAQEKLSSNVMSLVREHEARLQADMRYHQAKVDTLEEYERVNDICQKTERRY